MDFVSQFWGTTHHGREGKGWQQKHEADVHFVSVVRKQRERTVEAYLFSFFFIYFMFYSNEDSSQWDYPAYS